MIARIVREAFTAPMILIALSRTSRGIPIIGANWLERRIRSAQVSMAKVANESPSFSASWHRRKVKLSSHTLLSAPPFDAVRGNVRDGFVSFAEAKCVFELGKLHSDSSDSFFELCMCRTLCPSVTDKVCVGSTQISAASMWSSSPSRWSKAVRSAESTGFLRSRFLRKRSYSCERRRG